MKWVKRILKWGGAVLVLAVVGLFVVAFFWGRPPGQRPELVTALPEGVPPPAPGYPSEALSFIAAFTLHDIIAYENAPPMPGVRMVEDIEYGQGGDMALKLDVYLPEGHAAGGTGGDARATGDAAGAGGAKPDGAGAGGEQEAGKAAARALLPGLVLLYGGGWRDGRKDQLRVYAQHFAKAGYVVATPQYRLRDAGLWPNSVHDAKCAVRWMRAHAAEYGVDPERIGVMGNSAGAYLALMVGYTPGDPFFEGDGGWPEQSSAVNAVVDIYGPADFTEEGRRDHPLLTGYMNGRYEEDPSRFEKASPIRYVNEKTPPTCVIHGTVDMLVPVHQSDWLVEKLQKHGVPYLYSRIDGWPHAMDMVEDVNAHTRALIIAFFDEHLKKN